MRRSVRGMRGLTMHATDGESGAVDKCLCDDAQWTIRSRVAHTGGWLTGRRVCVAPIACRSVDGDRETFDVALTRQQVEQSPSIATDHPVARQQEEAYSRYDGSPYDWDELGRWDAGMYRRMADLAVVDSVYGETATAAQPTGDPHLHSARAGTGDAIQARDGALGHVEDGMVDDASWGVRSLVVETHNWWLGTHVLVSTPWIAAVRWAQSSLVVNLWRETIKAGPEYEPSTRLNRAYETRLHQDLQRALRGGDRRARDHPSRHRHVRGHNARCRWGPQ